MVRHGSLSWFVMVHCHGSLSWFVMVHCHGSSWFVMVRHGSLSWFVMVRDVLFSKILQKRSLTLNSANKSQIHYQIHEFGPEHGKMSLIQSYQKYIISLKTL